MKRLLLTLSLLGVMACGSVSQNKDTKSQSAALLSIDLPKAESYTPDTIDFGLLNAGEIIRGNFALNNKGETPLVIVSIDKACGCTETEYSKEPIAVGESRNIDFTFNSSGLYGAQIKYFTVILSDNSTTRVYFTADVNP
ncbi:MAG: DUF1573 domain-containing protein [Rikenellaceae bacterium]